jgi:photosystem II stability/assembly factor-like uncharacterized protein
MTFLPAKSTVKSSRTILPLALAIIAYMIRGCTLLSDEQPNGTPSGPLPPNRRVLDIEFATPSLGWLILRDLDSKIPTQIYKSLDSGKTWFCQYSRVLADHATIQRLSVVNENIVWAVGDSSQVYHTTDGGTRWSVDSIGTIDKLKDVKMVNEREGWIVGWRQGLPAGCGLGYNAVLHTTDGGEHWLPSYQGTDGPLSAVAVVNSKIWVVGGGILDGGCPALIIHSNDNGLSWQHQFVSGAFLRRDVAFANESVGYSIAPLTARGRTLIRTTNGGMDWDTLNHSYPDEEALDIALVGDSIVYLSTSRADSVEYAVLRSSDMGRFFAVEIAPAASILSIFFLNDSTGWAAGLPSFVARKTHGVWHY